MDSSLSDLSSAKPWIHCYEEGVPAQVEIPSHTLPESLQMAARQYPDSTAIVFFNHKMAYRELDAATTRFAGALQGLGIRKGDRVMLSMPNCPQFVIAFYGTLRAGGIVVPANPQYVPREMVYQVRDSGAETIVALTMTWKVVREARLQTLLKNVILSNIKDYFPPMLRVLFTVAREKKDGHRVDIRGEKDVHEWTKLMQEDRTPTPVAVNQEDIAVLGYTGGTTGTPKGAILTHRNLVAQSAITLSWFTEKELGKDVFMGALPLFHSFGLTCVMNTAVHSGAAMVLVPNPRDLSSVLAAAHKHRPTIFAGVPTMYAGINNFPNLGKYDLRSIKGCTSGAAPLPLEVQKAFEQITGGSLVEGYGLTETCSPTHINPLKGTRKIGTIGVPVPNTLAKIVDPETHKDLAIGEIGEIAVQSPQVMQGYWNKPEETAQVLLEGGWFLTGDLGKMDHDGFFTVVDRKKDMFIVGGFNVYPREIEEVLYAYPKVLEAAAVGIPDIRRGDNIKAFVVLKPGQSATAEEIIAYCRMNLTPYKVPREVEFRDSLPKTLVGKILRRILRDEELERARTTGSAPG